MKNLGIVVAVLSAVVFLGINNNTSKELVAYKKYYKATEAFLDTLELEYGWVDSYDPQEYYEAVEELYKYK